MSRANNRDVFPLPLPLPLSTVFGAVIAELAPEHDELRHYRPKLQEIP